MCPSKPFWGGFARLAVMLTLCITAFLSFVRQPALAQSAIGALELKVPAVFQVESGVEMPFPIEIAQTDIASDQTMILVRGIPSSATLSGGRLFASGVWAIKPSSASSVKILATSDIVDESHLTISLVTLSGEILDEETARLVIAPNANAEPVGSESLSPDQQKILTLMRRGDEKFREGKVNAARLFYERAAEMGSADGAFAVAMTYDPGQLQGLPLSAGTQLDAELARQWYEKARSLGSKNAASKLEEIGQRSF